METNKKLRVDDKHAIGIINFQSDETAAKIVNKKADRFSKSAISKKWIKFDKPKEKSKLYEVKTEPS